MKKQKLDEAYEKFKKQIDAAIAAVQNINASSLGDFAKKLAEVLGKLKNPTGNSGGWGGKGGTSKSESGGQASGGWGKKYHDGGIVGGTPVLKSIRQHIL